MTKKFDEMTIQELNDRWAKARADLEHNLVDACLILIEFRRRGQSRAAWRQGVFRWATEIASGKLDPLAALTLSESAVMINSIIGMPLEEQRRLAEGGDVEVAVLRTDGEVVLEKQSLATMPMTTFARVFDEGAVRSYDAQRRLLVDRTSPQNAHRSSLPLNIRVSVATEEIIVGQIRLKVSEVALALSQMGFEVRRRVDAEPITA
jgi:hypothetical protein